MKNLYVILFFLGTVSMGYSQDKLVSEVLAPTDFHEEIQQENVQLIDVRTPEEFAAGHLEGAVNIDFLAEDFMEQMKRMDRDKPLHIYCRSGNRSGKAAVKLSAAGYNRIVDLKGGYLAWEEFLKE